MGPIQTSDDPPRALFPYRTGRMHPNRRAAALEGSATLALDARAKALAASGVDVVNLAVGEPDFDAPPAVQEAAAAAVRGGNVRYTPAAGRPSLRAAIARHLAATRGVQVTPAEVAVTHSAKHALSHALLALVEDGDEVLLPAPCWNSYWEQVRIAGGVAVLVPPRADIGPDLEALGRAVGPRTRGVMVNTPTNPSGYVWSRGEIEQLVDLAQEHDLWILSDEIYGRLVYDGAQHVSPLSVSPAGRARSVLVDGASKTFAMTGYRIGYLAAPEPVIEAVTKLQSQVSGSPNAVSQSAFEAALGAEPPEVAEMIAAYDERRRTLLEGLRELGLETPEPRGAYYAFPSVKPFLDERGARGFCADLLDREALAIVPGDVFGMEGHVRLSYASSLENARRALERLERFLVAQR